MKYRWLIALIILGAAGGGLWLSLPDAPASVREGDSPAAISLPDLQGNMQSLPKGDVILLNFWATWCPPCRKEMPSMVELYRKLSPQGLKVIAISVDKNRDDLLSFVEEYSLPFQILHDADSVAARKFGVFRFPESFLIDRKGTVVHHLVGAVDWMSEPMLQVLTQMLEKPDSGGDREVRGVRSEDSGSDPI
jgi:DsbE subfamily thiol:disulfide oxidoreductase